MIVLHLTDCPPGLRGEVTKWLMEIASGVYVGQVSARVRDKLWHRIQEACRKGRAVLVYSTNNEQRLDFRVHGDTWEPIDFDGIKLMLRPSASRLKKRQIEAATPKEGFSNAAKRRISKSVTKASGLRAKYPKSYIVVDVETTGLNADMDEIIEIGAIKVVEQKKVASFQKLILSERPLPSEIMKLTGITNENLAESGRPLKDVMEHFSAFLADTPMVAHNMSFDKAFLDAACVKCGLKIFTNRAVDTLALSRRLKKGLLSYKLEALAEYFGIDAAKAHRSLSDCETTWLLYQKLMCLMDDGM